MGGAASGTAVVDYKAFFWVLGDGDGNKDTAAIVCAVAGVDVYVQRAKALRAMVAGGIAKGGDLDTAVDASEALVVFGEARCLH